MLIDRRRELEALDRLLGAVREGLSGTLVLRGEPGIGKTALLDQVVEGAADFRVARVVGVESEMTLSFAALHQLLVPLLQGLNRLPMPQRNALRTAFGEVGGGPPDRFLVGLATLTLLADAALERPLLILIDDAQWLDRESAEVLAFVARRLHADRVAVLFAIQDPTEWQPSLEGLPQLALEGLPEKDARELLGSVVAGGLHDRVGAQIVSETRGNPLALLELAGELTPAQLAGGSHLPDPLPLGARLEEHFLRQVRSFPSDTQALLLLASASPSGDPAVFLRAAERLGLDTQAAAAPAEAEHLLVLAPRVIFRHPLIRSAVYGGASAGERRRAHAALAEAGDPAVDADQRAWHRAMAAVGPDEEVANELERSAGHAQSRGGYAASAAFLELAAELTPEVLRRPKRLLAAAEAELMAGAPVRAEVLLDQADRLLEGQVDQAHALRLRGQISFALGRGSEAAGILLAAARALSPLDTKVARETFLEAIQAVSMAGPLLGHDDALQVARAAFEAPSIPRAEMTAADLLFEGRRARVTVGYAAAVAPLRQAVAALSAEDLAPAEGLRWLGAGWVVAADLMDESARDALANRWVQLARAQGALSVLPAALSLLGLSQAWAGRLAASEVSFAEGREISEAIGVPGLVGWPSHHQLIVLAWLGREEEARAAAEAVTRDAIERGFGMGISFTHYALAVLELSVGRYEEALAFARSVFEADPVYLGMRVLPELVEAATRSGDNKAAADGLERLSTRAVATGTPWALGLLARSRALLAKDAEAEPLYGEAIELLEGPLLAPDLARAHLLYGEWLRRQRRRVDARDELRTALEMFNALGGEAFEQRARTELLATGGRARKRRSEAADELTPQEMRVASLASEGSSSPEIAAQLFISASTVDYHLHKVFRKLGINSRTQLHIALPDRVQRDDRVDVPAT
jgi:DNA-binding CsgD family transcriptional regulator